MSPKTQLALATALEQLAVSIREEVEEAARQVPPADLFKPIEVAHALNTSRTWVLELIARGPRNGGIAATRMGGSYRVERAEVERLRREGIQKPADRRRRRLVDALPQAVARG